MNPSLSRWMPALRKAALVAAGAVLLFGVVGYFAIPRLARWGVETVATRELGRKVSVQEITANPYTLRVTLRGLEVAGAPGEAVPLLTVRELVVNASAGSIFRLAPVLDALTIDGLTANLARLDAQQFNFSDIVERFRARPKTSDEPARFSVSNIEVSNSTINLDDRPVGRKHALTDLTIGLPFISSLPVDSEINVQPAFAAKLNGAPIEAHGDTHPFKDTLESTLDIKLDRIDIPTYLAYSPVPLNFTVPRGRLATDLKVSFRRAAPAKADRPAQPAQLLLSGSFGLSDFALSAPAAGPQPLISWKSLRVALDEVEPLARRAVVGDIALDAPVIEVRRDTSGAMNWLRFAQAPVLPSAASASSAPESSTSPAAAAPFAFTLRHAAVTGGTVNFTDESVGRFELQLQNLNADASELTTTSAGRGKVKAGAEIGDNGGSIALEGDVGLAPIAGQLRLAGRDVTMRTPARYLANIIVATLDGSSDVDAVLDFALAPEKVAVIRDVAWRGKGISLRGPAGTGAEFDLDTVAMEGGEIDLTRGTITIGKIGLDGPRTTVRRLADGQINWLAALHARQAKLDAATPEVKSSSESWKVLLKELTVARGDLRLEDFAVEPVVKLRASAITGSVRNITSAGKEPAELDLRTRFGSGGTLAVNGKAGWNPIASELQLDARNLDIATLRPYLAARLNAVLAKAELSGRGRATVARASTEAPIELGYKGNLRLGNLHLLDVNGENDLLKWQILELQQMAIAIGKPAPSVSVGKIALSDFYARVIVSDKGRLNLVDLIRREGAPATTEADGATMAAASESPPAPASGEAAATPTAPPAAATAGTAPAESAARPVIRIGQIDIVRGNVNFTDNFIKPNYTANMTGLNGTVTTLASDSAEPATMTVAGLIDEEAPVDINGRLNPLAPKLFLDIEGRTKGVDLPRLTPYSVKYAGYPIVKGKLSMEVKYKVEDGKLAANNHLFLDQLTFGDKVESPTATKLPVLLAVSLLKNSKGEIDINLPISGTLNDPKFSVGGIIIQVIVNVLTKIVTAPFTLLAAAFGGGEELGMVEFAAGSAALAPEQTKRVDTLSKALSDRPGLKLDIIGRVDPALDTEGVKRAKLEAKLRAAKVRRTVRGSGEAIDPATVTITAEERPELMAAVYSAEDIPNKPRNFIGIAKSIPPAEMEALLLASLAVTPEDLRALANQRATAVRNRLEEPGKVPRERLFLVEPKLTAEGIKDKGATTRVDFSLK
ncbi:MAG TPA: DUF748 domain-containing protein [Burkholderiaceae bacterium]|nr:DUF748 domain-containing protein [Burkholderiaceae bacterium]HQR72580.1 DUF748 domain-containing protein [Burkholderiaceae bacterium]